MNYIEWINFSSYICDFDENGVKELLLFYFKNAEDPYTPTTTSYILCAEPYTLNNRTPEKIDEITLSVTCVEQNWETAIDDYVFDIQDFTDLRNRLPVET